MKVAVLGGDEGTRRAVDDAGGTVVDAAAAADAAAADATIAVGESALLEAAAEPVPGPILPVDAGIGRYDVPRRRLGAAVDALVDGAYRTVDQPTLSVDVDGEFRARAVLDAALMASEPAHISEYAVRAGGEAIDSFRADGVVVATPAGSEGYALDVGGPRVGPGTGVAVVPVSTYATSSSSWVLRPEVVLTVERDDAAVSLLVDDRVARRVDPHTPVTLGFDRDVRIVRPDLGPERRS
ncbi:MAG: hypothetical protein ABEJ28_10950 [Salinigranum sp.]